MRRDDDTKNLQARYKGHKSFVDKIVRNNTVSFYAFPKGMSFDGQEENEHIILVVRQHWAVFLPKFFMIALVLLLGILVPSLLGDFVDTGAKIGIFLLFLLFAVTMLFDLFFKWYFTIDVVTDQRVIDLDFYNVLNHRFSEAQLEKIEDVEHKHTGFLSSMFDYGTVYIQTAAARPEIEFDNIYRPRDVQDTILDLLEMKQEEAGRN